MVLCGLLRLFCDLLVLCVFAGFAVLQFAVSGGFDLVGLGLF